MKCQVCQFDLTPGATFCTNCGTPVTTGSPSSPNQGIAPTMLASTPPPANPYSTPEITPNPYNTPPPTSYGVPGAASAPNPYGAPAYDTPGVPAYGAPGAFAQPPYAQPQKKKGPNGCVIAIIIVASIFVLIVGGIVALVAVAARNGSTAAANVPTTSQVVASASANLSNAQTTKSVDSNYKPTGATTTFSTGDTIYITYDLAGNAGYVIEKTYDDSTGSIAIQTQTPHSLQSGDTNGYISFSLDASGSYTTGLYWCTQASCSDAALAAVVTFTVS